MITGSSLIGENFGIIAMPKINLCSSKFFPQLKVKKNAVKLHFPNKISAGKTQKGNLLGIKDLFELKTWKKPKPQKLLAVSITVP